MKTNISFDLTIDPPKAFKTLSAEELNNLSSLVGTLGFGALREVFKASLGEVAKGINNRIPTENHVSDAYILGLKRGEQSSILTILNLKELVDAEFERRKVDTLKEKQ